MKNLRQVWSRSKVYRVVLVLVVVYTLLRLVLQVVYLMEPDLSEDGEILAPYDLQIYLDAAQRIQAGQDLYLQEELERIVSYQYAPVAALLFVPFLWMSPLTASLLFTLFHICAYVLIYISWSRIFRRLKLEQAEEMLVWTLPVWLLFSAFWGDLAYLNIYVFSALLATLLIEAVLEERLGLALLWLSLILVTKPYWAFPIAVPLLLGRWRFFLKLAGLGALVYGLLTGLALLVMGPAYAWSQYTDYVRFVGTMRAGFPWRGPEEPYLGYNHSITQVIVYWFGVSAATLRVAMLVKCLLLLPLAAVGIRYLVRPVRRAGCEVPGLGLGLAFVLYLGVFIWLDVVWELTLGIAVFTYLLATLHSRGAKIWVWLVFLPYALLDLWQAISYAALGDDVVSPDLYVLTDPSIYVPLIMIVILTFYALLVGRLWSTAPAWQASRRGSGHGA